MDRGLGIFLDQNEQSAEEDEEFGEHEDAETLEGAESVMEKDEWVWPNVGRDRILDGEESEDGTIALGGEPVRQVELVEEGESSESEGRWASGTEQWDGYGTEVQGVPEGTAISVKDESAEQMQGRDGNEGHEVNYGLEELKDMDKQEFDKRDPSELELLASHDMKGPIADEASELGSHHIQDQSLHELGHRHGHGIQDQIAHILTNENDEAEDQVSPGEQVARLEIPAEIEIELGRDRNIDLGKQESSDSLDPAASGAEEQESSDGETRAWEDVRENGFAVHGTGRSDSTSTAATHDATSPTGADLLALDTERSATPPTSPISQVGIPNLLEASGSRTPQPSEFVVEDAPSLLTNLPRDHRNRSRSPVSPQVQMQWTRLLVEDRAWLVLLLTLYMMMMQQ